MKRPLPPAIGGWEIKFNWTGVPFEWTPLSPLEAIGLVPNQPVLVEADAAIERRERSKSVAVLRRGRWAIGRDLEIVLQQLFGVK